MQIATTNQTATWPHLRSKNKYKTRKPEQMFFKLIRKFFWMSEPNHRHSIDHLSDHLKRDMGLIERDFSAKSRHNDQHPSQIKPSLWL